MGIQTLSLQGVYIWDRPVMMESVLGNGYFLQLEELAVGAKGSW